MIITKRADEMEIGDMILMSNGSARELLRTEARISFYFWTHSDTSADGDIHAVMRDWPIKIVVSDE